MRFYKKLYVTDKIRNIEKVKQKLLRGEGEVDLYVLVLEESGKNISFMHSAMLQQPYYHMPNCCNIFGLARGYTDTMELLVKIIEETNAKTGGVDVVSYLFPNGIDAAFEDECVLKRRKEIIASPKEFITKVRDFVKEKVRKKG